MPSWNTFNAKFKNLASSTFSQLYEHFSTNEGSLKISIDGVDSGLEITKSSFDNDTLCQWLVRNNLFSTKYYIERQSVFSIHNIKVVSSVEQESKDIQKEKAEAVQEQIKEEKKETPAEQPIEMTEEEFNALGLKEVGEDEENEEDEYSFVSPVVSGNNDFTQLRKIKTSEDIINVVRKKYPRLAKLINIAIDKIGLPEIKLVLSNEEGELVIINGVERQRQGTVVQNNDNSWTITIFKNSNHPIKTLAHEVVHIFTLGAIKKNTDCVRACKIFYQYCKDSFAKDEETPYGLKNFKEFVAEFFTNPEFREYLKSKSPIDQQVFDVAIKNIPVEHKSRIRTLYDSILSFFTKVWQKYILRQSPSMYSQIYDIMEKLFGDAQNTRVEGQHDEYSIKNHVTNQTVTLQNCKSRAQLRAAIDGIMREWIRHDDITAIGKNIDKLNFSTKAVQKRLEQDTEFAQWWQRTFTYSSVPIVRELTKITRPTDEKLKTKDNPEGFVMSKKKAEVSIKKKDGTVITKKVWMPTPSIKLPNWDVMTPIMDEFMSDMRIETRKKVEDRAADEEMEQREDGRNTFGELLTESFEIDPFTKASREVKWMFSTVPYGRVVKYGGQLKFEETLDHNEFGLNTFMPFKDVYGKVLYYTANCRTTSEILEKFYRLAHTGPDKAMFLYLYESLSDMIANRWTPIEEDNYKKDHKSKQTKNSEGLTFDANIDSTIIKVIRALRQQQNNFIQANAEDVVDKDGNKYKKIDIKTTLYQKKAIETTRNWKDQLSTGMSGVLRYDAETQTYKFSREIKGNLFQKIYSDLFVGKNSFISAYNKIRKQDPEDVVLDWLYLPNSGTVKFSEITEDDVKTYLHNALLQCGIDVCQEVIDQWINQIMSDNPTIGSEMDALYVLLSDQHSIVRPSNFFARLANMGENGDVLNEPITVDTINNAFNSGFVKELSNLQNEYDLRTQGLMTVAPHNNQYYVVSENNYINDIKDIINSHDESDSYIQMLLEDSFAQGSSLVYFDEKDQKYHLQKDINLSVGTFVGMKTKNIGDQGRDYFEIELDEDVISKLELLHEGYMISPTTSDKKTYHALKGIPLVGMARGVRSASQCYYINPNTGEISITDLQILDRFIEYFKSERNAVEKAIVAYETKFYKKNPGKKIANYSDENGLKFASFCCLPLANGEKIYLNKDIKDDPRVNLNIADKNFFSLSKYDQRKIMQRILLERAQEDIKKITELGLVKIKENGLYDNIGLDGATILEMAQDIVKQTFGANAKLNDYVDQNGKHFGPRKEFAISAAVQEYIIDCSIKHLMSMQEYQRLFSGSKSFYKWKSKGVHITDISVDYTKRRGGDISTGGVNVYDIDPLVGMEELGTYRCIEIEDYLVESTTLGKDALIKQFQADQLVSTAASILLDGGSPMNVYSRDILKNLYKDRDSAEKIIFDKYYNEYTKVHGEDKQKATDYANGIINTLKAFARANAMKYFKDIDSRKDPINVADGATYITDRMCERLLREEGKWDDDMKYAFEVLRGEHGEDVMSEKGRDLYKSILDVIIGTQKYTATGFRKSDDGSGGTLMTPYYNKTALFPIFEQIAYGKMGKILQAMRDNNVDVMMMTSAVKTGGQGALTIDQFLDGTKHEDHTYIQEIRFLRKQLNTDPNEREEMNLGTQTIKIALSNLRMDDDYIDPFTGEKVSGRQLYSKIMRCYNILTDIGFEQVLMRFCKKNPDGSPKIDKQIHANVDEKGRVREFSNIAGFDVDIDEKALSDFLREELRSRDASDNMFDAIAYDKNTDRLAAPVSAISQSGWIDSILSSYISKTIIDTKSPGSAYIQRSVFSMEGDDLKTLNDGKDLRLVNDDGSMDAIISIDFFEKIIPNYHDKTFEEARQWLIDHKLIGEHAKTYSISYRIPTQASSSINPLKFVDVIPIVRDTIILPKDFTSLTGSDFDIDKLFISRLFINPETVHDADQMFTFYDKGNSNKEELLEDLRKGFVNKLFQNYIALLMDKQSTDTRLRSIDVDTDLWKDVHKDLYPEDQSPVESMSQDTIAYQTEQKNNFVVGKIGIGPYALNNNNHIYTMLYNISVRSDLLGRVGMNGLYKGTDIYGKSIMSWLSGGINAHVDIAKDPFVTKLNINKYTYNISNFLIRAGFGKNALWFLNQPVIKELAKRQNAITGQYLKSTAKSIFDAQADVFEQYKEELGKAIPEEVLNRQITEDFIVEYFNAEANITKYIPCLYIITGVLGRPLTVRDVLIDAGSVYKAINYSDKINDFQKRIAREGLSGIYRRDFENPYIDDMIETDQSKSMIYREAKHGSNLAKLENQKLDPAIQRYMSVVIFNKINSNEAKICSDIVKFTKIDTKKHGSTIAAQLDYKIEYQNFIAGLDSSRPKVLGNTEDLFGISSVDNQDLTGFNTSLRLSGRNNMVDYTGLAGELPGNLIQGGVDITEAGYIDYQRNKYSSFIHNKTRKAINALSAILRRESIESTYGFEYAWRFIKNDFDKHALTEDMQTKLRSTILGAIKSKWVFNSMRNHGIDPISLFKDGEGTLSLAHELVKMKTRVIRHTEDYVNRNGETRQRTVITTVANVFKDNALLKILHDAHTQDEYNQAGRLTDVLDFVKVHIPFTDDKVKINEYINAWKELYENDLTRDFAVKLMYYSFIVSNDQGGNNLFKYVPFDMLQEYGLFNAEREIIDMWNDPSQLYVEDLMFVKERLQPIIDRVETILCEDFDFSQPFHLESKQTKIEKVTGKEVEYNRKEYTGFGSVFGNFLVDSKENEDSDRIPYVFIPVRKNAFGGISYGKDFVNSYGNLINRPYVRVYNPAFNFENDQKYFIYKRIGVINMASGIQIPIYRLINSSMYTLGQYKVYNYENEMPISATQILKTAELYLFSSKYSVQDLNDFISDAVRQIMNGAQPNIDVATAPLKAVDAALQEMNKKHQQEYRIYKILSKYENYEYLEFFKNKDDNERKQMIEDLQFVKNNDQFSEEEKNKADEMLTEIKQLQQAFEQAKAGRKAPNSANDPSTYHMHSGGANGADTMWDYYGKQYGMPDDPQHFAHYYFGSKTPNGNTPITREQYFEGLDHVFAADQVLQRFDKMSEDRQKTVASLLARNWMQVKNADAVFAIGELKYGKVDGGTGWAVQMAIDSQKPVHVFNLSTEQWFTYDYQKGSWTVEQTPKLTKNFAGIGTRSIDRNIEQKTANQRKPVKYVGDQKRDAAIKAINDVYRNTFGNPIDPTIDLTTFNGPNNPADNFNGPKESKEVLESPNTILSNKEILKLKPYIGSDTHPRIAVASEHSDLAFLSSQIVDLFDNGKPLVVKSEKYMPSGRKTKDGKDIYEKQVIETTYTAKDFDALYIITKHDGLPLKRILQTKIPKLIHFSVTGMGNTVWEPGVMKYQDMLKRIKDFMKMGLDPEMVTMRIDPIIPGVTPFEVIEDIVKQSSAMGIKTIKFSVMDWYKSTAPEVVKNTGYDYSKYYEPVLDKDGQPFMYWWCPKDKNGKPIPGLDGKPQWEKHIVYEPHAKVEEQKKISDFMLSLKDKYGVTLQSCAEPLIQEGIEKVGCLSVPAINNMLGTHIEDRGVDNNKQRALCTCYGGKTDLMSYNQNCASVCWYCYAHHQGDKILDYYNPDGTLKDNIFTRTLDPESNTSDVGTVQSGVDPESWSKKEGWSVDYFHKKVAPRLHEAWQIEYELVQDTEEQQQNSNQESSYTYSDGTIIKTPFQLTVEQANALEKIEEFINGDENVLTVSGYAGTGKTSVMEIVAEKHKKDRNHNVVFTASTNKASSVLGSKVGKKGFSSTTLDKYFKIKQVQKTSNIYYDAKSTQSQVGTIDPDHFGDIVIIDEASMINREKYDIIVKSAKQNNLKIIFLGDIAQLPPVGESISPVFQNNQNLIQLTEVKRTGDNAILKEATNLRQTSGTFSYESSFNSKGEGVAFTYDRKDIFDVISEYAPHLKENSNFIKIIAGTNKAVESYNNIVRKLLGYDSPIPQVGENVMGYDNWGRIYNRQTGQSTYKIMNSEDYIVTHVGETKEKTILINGNYEVDITYTPIILEDSQGTKIEVPYVLYSQNQNALNDIADTIQRLIIFAKNAKGRDKAFVIQEIDRIKNEIMVDRDITDERGYTVIKKSIDFGYAITSHKSQGSTYKHVVIDKVDMDNAFGGDLATAQRMYYTAVSRATTTVTVYTKDTKIPGNPITNRVGNNKNTQQNIPEFTMYFPYQGQKRADVKADTTFDAILNGERTATTRYESDYAKYPNAWNKLRSLKEGDIITFRDTKESTADSRRVNVRITKPLHKLVQDIEGTQSEISVINVSSYNNDTKNLSNFAERPFKTELAKGAPQMTFNMVEQAFQCSKVYCAWLYGDINDSQFWDYINQIKKSDGKTAKSIGGNIPMTKSIKEWDKIISHPVFGKCKYSDKVLYDIMLVSFQQNPEASSELLRTGNAEFTHNYDNGAPIEPKRPKRFGTILAKVRSKLRDEQQLANDCK